MYVAPAPISSLLLGADVLLLNGNQLKVMGIDVRDALTVLVTPALLVSVMGGNGKYPNPTRTANIFISVRS